MNRCILVTRPKFDRTTQYISLWAQKVIDVARVKGDKILDLRETRANRREFDSMMTRHEPSFVFLNGHGTPTTIRGQNNEVLLEAGKNLNILQSKSVYALSCSSGSSLGPQCIIGGATGFIGYSQKFIFLIDPRLRTRPLEDKIAALFLEPSNQVAISLIKGHTVAEAHGNAKNFFIRNIRKLLTSRSSQAETHAVRYLWWDFRSLVFHGSGDATI